MLSSQRGSGRRTRPITPLALHWNSLYCPLPVREVQGTARSHAARTQPAPWIETGPEGTPFDFSLHLRQLCEDIVARTETLKHLHISRILFSFTQSRNGRSHGLQARITPLHFITVI